jgi:cytochrome P450
LGPRFLFVADPEIASTYLTTGQSLPKSHLTTGFLAKLLGRDNMVGLEGQRWKFFRSIFNPGFSASHLNTLVPYIVDATLVFLDILHEKAETNELVKFNTLTTRFTMDIIGKVVMDTDFNSQRGSHPIVTTFRRQVDLMPTATMAGPLAKLNLVREYQIWSNMRKLDNLIGAEIDKRVDFRNSKQQQQQQQQQKDGSTVEGKKDRKRSVVDLALDGYEKEMASSGGPQGGGKSAMADSFRITAIDSVKTFIFAGHDTTSSTLSYAVYLLHLHKAVQAKVVAELDLVFGADATVTEMAAAVKSDPHTVNKLEYMTAVVKETLRLFPPASTLRELGRPSDVQAAKYRTMVDPKTGNVYPLTGWDIWPIAAMIHRNEAYFPDPVQFVPERFIPAQTPYPDSKLHTPAGKDAWRPFEKGPRNCIGQELAMMELKIALGLFVKDDVVDFTPEYDSVPIHRWDPVETKDEYVDGRPGIERMTVEGHRPYQVLAGAAMPKDGLTGRLSLRS